MNSTEIVANVQLPSLAALKSFLRLHYKRDRFEGRDGVWCDDYSDRVTASYLADLRAHGEAQIGRHESNTGTIVRFGPDLTVDSSN